MFDSFLSITYPPIPITKIGPVFFSLHGVFAAIGFYFGANHAIKLAEKDGAKWYVLGDTRVTKVGKILRLFRIDELPQLLQVITGDMSLIGPRPERPEFDDKLSEKIPFYDYRYTIKPGLSGWAQVNYSYGSSLLDAENKLSYDIFYVKNFSIPLDLLIFFKTIRIVFTAKGT